MVARRILLAAALALGWLGAASVAGIPVAVPGGPAAAKATNPWQVSLAPMALTEGIATDVSVTVSDGSQMIGCVTLDVPAGFTVVGASVSSVPPGFVWTAVVSGSGPTRVTFSTTTDPWRLNGGSQAVFVVKSIATSSPLPPWIATAYKSFTVDSTQLDGGPLAAPGPFTISTAPTPAPVPTPAPTHGTAATPVPVATAAPAATPTPRLAPAPSPTAQQRPITPGTTASATASIIPSASPSETSSPSVLASTSASTDPAAYGGAGPAGGAGSAGGDGATGGVGATLEVQVLPDGGTVQLDNQADGGIGMFAWVVPGLFLSLPGLLLILVVAAQGAFAAIFVPVTRRTLGARRRSRALRHNGGGWRGVAAPSASARMRMRPPAG